MMKRRSFTRPLAVLSACVLTAALLLSAVPGAACPVNGFTTLRAGTAPLEQGLDFGGKTYTHAYCGTTWDDERQALFDTFEQRYNVELEVTGVAYDQYLDTLSRQMLAGMPYDAVQLYSFWYPQCLQVVQPLNTYLTTSDLWDETKQSGFSWSLMNALSYGGNIYAVGGNYRQSPTVLWYNKKLFADAGYDGAQDPLALYRADKYSTGKWSWETLYDMLCDVQDPDNGLWGINTLAPYYSHQFINTYDTDLVVQRQYYANNATPFQQNLTDSSLYDAYEMLQKYCYGGRGEYHLYGKVANPNAPLESGLDRFLDGTTASFIGKAADFATLYGKMNERGYEAFGGKAQQLINLGMVPVPIANSNGVQSVWAWSGYGAGRGATEDGVLCALALAKTDSALYHGQAYHPKMPAEAVNVLTELLDADDLRAPMDGFSSSMGGTLGGIESGLSEDIAVKGDNITVRFKWDERITDTIIQRGVENIPEDSVLYDVSVSCKRKEYLVGERLSRDDLTVYAMCTNGGSKVVTDYTVSGFSSATTGTKTITVTYQNITATRTVEVVNELTPTTTQPSATRSTTTTAAKTSTTARATVGAAENTTTATTTDTTTAATLTTTATTDTVEADAEPNSWPVGAIIAVACGGTLIAVGIVIAVLVRKKRK